MKKNTKTYLLLAVVALIWGTIGYKILFSLSSEPDVIANVAVKKFKPLAQNERDTFSILTHNRDPFLGTLLKKEKKIRIKSIPKPDVGPELNIQYTGFVKDQNAKKNIFFVTINGQQHLMSVNDEIQNVKLVSGSATSIRLRYNNKTRNIPLQQ